MITTEEASPSLEIPNRLFLFSVLLALLLPFVARMLAVPAHGWGWLTSYFPEPSAIFLLSAMNILPAVSWYVAGKAGRFAPLAYWISLASGIGFLLYSHGTLDLSSSSTAGLGLVFIPIYTIGTIIAGWLVGYGVSFTISSEKMSYWVGWGTLTSAVAFGVGASLL